VFLYYLRLFGGVQKNGKVGRKMEKTEKKIKRWIRPVEHGFFAYLLLCTVTGIAYWLVARWYSLAHNIAVARADSSAWMVMSIYLLYMFMDFVFLVIGGYITGRSSGENEVSHAAIVGAAALVLGCIFGSARGIPDWIAIATIICSIPMAMIGGLLARLDRIRGQNFFSGN